MYISDLEIFVFQSYPRNTQLTLIPCDGIHSSHTLTNGYTDLKPNFYLWVRMKLFGKIHIDSSKLSMKIHLFKCGFTYTVLIMYSTTPLFFVEQE